MPTGLPIRAWKGGRTGGNLAMLFLLTALAGCAGRATVNPAPAPVPSRPAALAPGPGQSAPAADPVEAIRTRCILGRRHVCGRVLQITPSGLVVDSGYTGLLQPPLNHSWLTRANVVPARPAALVEGAAPDAIAVGLLLLTDIPKRPAVHRYDYVALNGYPAGHYDYVPAPGVTNTIRRFAAGLETAVRLNLQP